MIDGMGGGTTVGVYLPPSDSECEVAGSEVGFPRERVGGGAHVAEGEREMGPVGVRRHASVRWKFRFGLLPCRLPRRWVGSPRSGLRVAFFFSYVITNLPFCLGFSERAEAECPSLQCADGVEEKRGGARPVAGGRGQNGTGLFRLRPQARQCGVRHGSVRV